MVKNMNVDEFLKNIKSEPKNYKGKLALWKEDILKLRRAGCTFAQISEYLQLQGLKTTESSIQKFCKKHLTPTAERQNPTTKTKSDSNSETTDVPQDRRLPSWAEIPGVKSIDDLI
ncbi:Uncharacterised protein [Oligella urethralis]|uniref:Uncharacterized protein n=2 Tax=Oligella urethralis TaxID=90245 RepID=A0A2X1UVM0_9BURK|nr:Uncharacterised protein [Oligella urethralis]